MPNIFSKALSAVTSAAELPTPPAFEPIAAILLPKSYKSDLSRIIRSAQGDFVNDRAWWGEIRKATGAKWADIKQVHSNVQKAASQPRANALDAIQKYTDTPLAKKDPTLQKMLETFSKRASKGSTKPEDLMKMQKIIASRLEKLNDKLEKALATRERVSRASGETSKTKPGSGETGTRESKESQGKPISEAVILESIFTDVVSKMSAFFASPQLTKMMVGEKYDKKRNQNLAKAAVYYLLQRMTDRAYEKLVPAGLDQRFMMKVWKNRNDPANRELLVKASKILGSDRFKAQVKPQVPPDPAKSTPGAPPVQDGADEIIEEPDESVVPEPQVLTPRPELVPEDPVVNTEQPVDAPPAPPAPQKKEEKPVSTGAMIYRKMMSAARAAKKSGQDPTAMADYVLQRYEEEKIPEAAIVRRMFERATGVGK